MAPDSRYRLPRTVTPSRYAIELRLDPSTPTFDGSMEVSITVHESVAEIVLNAKDVTIHRASVVGKDVVDVDKVVPDEEAERVSLTLPAELAPGDYVVRADFTGRLSDLMEGMYRSRYTDDAGVEHVIITTHFEATDARRNFPCWDEPDLEGLVPAHPGGSRGRHRLDEHPRDRARARRRGVHASALRGVDGDVDLSRVRGGRDLALTQPSFAGPTPIRVACRPDRVHLADYANEVGVFALNWFGDYYGIPYPERKLDQAGIPDFAQGAMENTAS